MDTSPSNVSPSNALARSQSVKSFGLIFSLHFTVWSVMTDVARLVFERPPSRPMAYIWAAIMAGLYTAMRYRARFEKET